MKGIPVAIKDLPKKLLLYTFCSPSLDMNFRCLPREGGVYNQDYVDIVYFKLIEERIVDIMRREGKLSKRKP